MWLVYIFFLVLTSLLVLEFWEEKKLWNQGTCKECGQPWEFNHTEKTGGRVYICQCGRKIWITWTFIDNKRKKENK